MEIIVFNIGYYILKVLRPWKMSSVKGRSNNCQSFCFKIIDIIVKNNISEFHDALYVENIGAAMGGKTILPYAKHFRQNRWINNAQ